MFLVFDFGLHARRYFASATAAVTTPAADGPDFSDTAITAAQAWQSAERIGAALTGQRGHLRETSRRYAYSPRRRGPTRFWEISCDIGQNPYVFRIDADTGKVVTVNSLALRPTGSDGSERVWSVSDAEEKARGYLYAVSSGGDSSARWFSRQHPVARLTRRRSLREGTWTFRFRVKDEQDRQRLAVVSVDARNGALVSTLFLSHNTPRGADTAAPGV